MDIGTESFEGTLQEVRRWSEKRGSTYCFGSQLQEIECHCRVCIGAKKGYEGKHFTRKELRKYLDNHSRKHIA